MDVIDLNTLNPKTYGNLTLNKQIDKKYRNKHSHSSSRRDQIWKPCMECWETCRNPHKCRYVPRRQQMKQFIKKEIRIYKTTKYTQNNIQPLLETKQKPESPSNTLRNNLKNGMYGRISVQTQSSFIKYPFLQQLLPFFKSLNNWTMQQYRKLDHNVYSTWTYDMKAYRTWQIKIECMLKKEWLSRFQSMNPKLKMLQSIDKNAVIQHKYRKNNSYYTKRIKSPKVFVQRLFEDSGIIQNCGSQQLFHGLIRSIFGEVIVPREIVELLLKYSYDFLLESLLPYKGKELNEHHSLKYHYIRAGDLLSCYSIDDTMTIPLAREWMLMNHHSYTNRWKPRIWNKIYIGAMLKPWGEGENTVAYVDFVPIFKITHIELLEKRKVKKGGYRRIGKFDEKNKVPSILEDYYAGHLYSDGWGRDKSGKWIYASRIKELGVDEMRIIGWNKNSDVLKYQKVRDECRYRRRRWNANDEQ